VKQSPNSAELLTVPEAAARLGISSKAYYRAVRRGDVPAIHIGRHIKVPKPPLDRLIETGSWKVA
jgi:excisionase family DNA binding protein